MKKPLTLLSLSILTLTACQTAPQGTEETGPIKIGYIGPQTGDAAVIGADMLYGTQMAVDEANAAGGINGREIVLIAEDGRCSGGESTGAAQKLISIDNVIAIIGGQCSSETLAAAPIAEAAEVPLVSPVSSSPDVTDAGDFVFRSYPSDDLKGKAFATVFTSKQSVKVAIISENTDFCQGMVSSIEKYLPENTEIVFNEFVEPETKDFRSLLTRLQDIDFDAFVVNTQSPVVGAILLTQFRENNFEQIAFGTDTTDSMSMFENAEGALENFYVVSVPVFENEKPFTQTVLANYEPQFGLGYIAHAYDSTNVVLEAIENVGTDGSAIRDYLYALQNYDGEIGSFYYDDNGDVVGIPFALKEFINGSIVQKEAISVQ